MTKSILADTIQTLFTSTHRVHMARHCTTNKKQNKQTASLL